MNKDMWEILIPAISNDGNPHKEQFHKDWDKKVYEISGGMTVMTPSTGKWICPAGSLFEEKMIPVRILATREEIEQIINFTLKYYNQSAVLAYKISNETILKYNENSS